MIRGQRFRLYPTRAQESLLRQACGVARKAWNWGLAIRRRLWAEVRVWVSSAQLQKGWNALKATEFPYVSAVTKLAAEQALRALDKAQAAYRKKTARRPRFHKKGVHDSFCAGRRGEPTTFYGTRVNLPRIGRVKCGSKQRTRVAGGPRVKSNPGCRWPGGEFVQARVRRVAGRWWLSVTWEVPDPKPLPAGRPACGIDLGCTTFAAIASEKEDGCVEVEKMPPPKPYAKAKRRLQRASRQMKEKERGSRRYAKARVKLARLHERVANIRNNFLHQLSSRVVKRYGTVVLEDLNVKGLARGLLSKTIRDLGWGEFRRQVEYKAQAAGTRVVIARRTFASSRRCSRCGAKREKLELSERLWTCAGCGVRHDRDGNAAENLRQLGVGYPEGTHAETGEQVWGARRPEPVPVVEA